MKAVSQGPQRCLLHHTAPLISIKGHMQQVHRGSLYITLARIP
jgi:hypothetical protein